MLFMITGINIYNASIYNALFLFNRHQLLKTDMTLLKNTINMATLYLHKSFMTNDISQYEDLYALFQ